MTMQRNTLELGWIMTKCQLCAWNDFYMQKMSLTAHTKAGIGGNLLKDIDASVAKMLEETFI